MLYFCSLETGEGSTRPIDFHLRCSLVFQKINLPMEGTGRFKATDANRLRQEYTRLVEGLAQRGNLPG